MRIVFDRSKESLQRFPAKVEALCNAAAEGKPIHVATRVERGPGAHHSTPFASMREYESINYEEFRALSSDSESE